MTNEREALLAYIIDHPAEFGVYGVYADWLDENNEPRLAHAYRWMGRHGKRPWVSDLNQNASWSYEGVKLEHQLVRVLWNELEMSGKNSGHYITYFDWNDAVAALADALVTLTVIRDEKLGALNKLLGCDMWMYSCGELCKTLGQMAREGCGKCKVFATARIEVDQLNALLRVM